MSKIIVFDYDGTIHKSDFIYLRAVREVHQILVIKGLIENKSISDERIKRYIGLSVNNMWDDFAPKLSFEQKKHYGKMIGNSMNKLIENGEASLYIDATSTLDYLLNKDYKLIILSNCKRKYMDVSRKTFKLDNYFIEYYCAEDFDYIPKYMIMKEIVKKHGFIKYLVGDKESDILAGIKNNIESVGCLYGYGSLSELKNASFLIDSIEELKKIIN